MDIRLAESDEDVTACFRFYFRHRLHMFAYHFRRSLH